MFCTSCGTKGRPGAAFCTTCGTRLLLPQTSEPSATVPSVTDLRIPFAPAGLQTLPTPPADNAYPPGYGPPGGSGPPPGSFTYSETTGLVDPILNLSLAPWWKRLLAIIIDWSVLGAGYFILFGVIGAITTSSQNGTTTTNSQNSAGTIIIGFIGILILASIPNSLYFGLMNGSKRGQTLGKMALSITVRDSRSGEKIGFWRAVGRFFFTVALELLLYVPFILDSLTPLWNKRRQAWHDKVVHSVVVDLKP